MNSNKLIRCPLLPIIALAVSGCTTTSKTTKAPAGQADAQPNEILQGVQGYLVQIGDAKGSILGGRPKSGTRIVATSLPTKKEKTIHTLQRGPITHNLSGPDESGRVAYIEDYFFVPDVEKRHLLKCVTLENDKETTIFTKPGSAMWATSAVQTNDGHGVVSRRQSIGLREINPDRANPGKGSRFRTSRLLPRPQVGGRAGHLLAGSQDGQKRVRCGRLATCDLA